VTDKNLEIYDDDFQSYVVRDFGFSVVRDGDGYYWGSLSVAMFLNQFGGVGGMIGPFRSHAAALSNALREIRQQRRT
jgi:hypothetical protein